MRILFLDFDGVINTPVGIDENGNVINDYNSPLDGKVNNFIAVKLIEKFCKENNFRIVVQSRGWRNYLETNLDGTVRYRPYKSYLENSGLDGNLVLGHVPFLKNQDKGDEIEEYLKSHKTDFFIVVDDDDNQGVDKSLLRFKDRLIVCNGMKGFTEKEYLLAKEIFEREVTNIR